MFVFESNKTVVFTNRYRNQKFSIQKDGTISVKGFEAWGVLGSDGTSVIITTNRLEAFRFNNIQKTVDVVSYVMFPDLATHPALLTVVSQIGDMSKGSYTKSVQKGPSMTL